MGKLQTEIKYLTGIGPKRAEILNKDIEVFTIKDLLYYFPYKYIDRTKFYSIAEVNADLPYIQIKGKITKFNTVGEGPKKRLTALFTDGTGFIELVWFKGIKWVMLQYKPDIEYIVYGKPTQFGHILNIAHPEMDEVAKTEQVPASALQPQYNTSERMKSNFLTSRTIHKLITTCLKATINEFEETFPDYLIKTCKLIPLKEALTQIHFPASTELLNKAEFRLKFEELFTLQLSLLRQKRYRQQVHQGYIFSNVGHYVNTFYKLCLPFELTNAQKRVIKEIRQDLGSGKQMNRLLQGDVGSGKTLVALMISLIALDNNLQVCIMAPTEILAAQHFKSISRMIEGLDVNIRLLKGSTRKKERTVIHQELTDGTLQILVGTHALIEDNVQFKKLGLAIIDEQHRFGVAQRAKLRNKSAQPPHVLVMTATPIPRTLTMTAYGDLDVSVIDELPPGRKPIYTKHIGINQRMDMYKMVAREIQSGRQVYIVYPLIKESETLDYKALEQGYEQMQKVFPAPQYSISAIHGKMSNEDKESIMKTFKDGKTNILMATTVIEVGVDVPNASVMIIESAERFGLSQLHQLRGRVGRGSDKSYCFLCTSFKLSTDARKRLEIMESTNNGFTIAEADWKLRGPGNIEGTEQSGMPFSLHIANLGKDQQILQYARDLAQKIIDDDPHLQKSENLKLNILVSKTKKEQYNWELVG
jgi:ATP-dependent DNA helicase RecG